MPTQIVDPALVAIVNEYQRGALSTAEIIDKYHLSTRAALYRILDRYGVAHRLPWRHPSPPSSDASSSTTIAVTRGPRGWLPASYTGAEAYPARVQVDNVVHAEPMWAIHVVRTIREVRHVPAPDAQTALAAVESDTTVTDIVSLARE